MPIVQNNNYEFKTYCKCKKCGYDKAEVNMNSCLCLGCLPPIYKYSYKCSECGEVGSVTQEETYGSVAINTEPIEERLYGHCLICGKQVATNKTQGEVICDECKEAIKWAKKQINNSPSPNWEISDRERAIMFGQEEKIKKAFEQAKAQEETKQKITSKKPLDSLQEEINYAVKNRVGPKYIGKEILEEWNARFELVKQDLEVLENLKSKCNLFYRDRHMIAKEYEEWCRENNAQISDTTNMVTWLLGIKLKEWIVNDK